MNRNQTISSALFSPDETALLLWKRIQEESQVIYGNETDSFVDSFQPTYSMNDINKHNQSINQLTFPIRVNNHQIYEAKFREGIEIQATSSEVPEVILNMALEFASKYDNGLIIHISTGNNLFRSLQQSGVDLTNVPLYKLHRKGKVKTFTVLNTVHLLALIELLRQTLQGETVLLLFEEMIPLFLTQKNLSGSLPTTSHSHSILKGIGQLQQIHTVLSIWVNTSIPKSLLPTKDPFFILWRQKIPKHFNNNPN